ncbi:hypothetical protein PIB30_046974 [Stylosanthes scabra]|uniref:Leucine-rich repeat-containing N-terminal plant-type domain-containing protein n=1 Tax=Stylosanthes scabra TaxID=79078 RepID=A0ABU6UJA6_9FABA|nr:hypothetical protein [Stylosanthes scabra]
MLPVPFRSPPFSELPGKGMKSVLEGGASNGIDQRSAVAVAGDFRCASRWQDSMKSLSVSISDCVMVNPQFVKLFQAALGLDRCTKAAMPEIVLILSLVKDLVTLSKRGLLVFDILQGLKNSFAIDTYRDERCSSYPNKIASWKNGTDCCHWDGVTCDNTSGHVIGLDLSCAMLEGKFHPNSTLFHLTHLQQLNLAFNFFSLSSIHPRIGDLASLMHLNLSSSTLCGDIPSTISHLSKLVSLDLSNNNFGIDGGCGLTLDESTWSKLIGNTTNLKELLLDDIDMSSIRETSLSLLTNFSSSFLLLSLPDTGLHGKFPTSAILGLPNLAELSLSGNEELKVELPKSNWSTPLRILDLSFIPFSGEIPDSIGHLKSLNQLILNNCQFDGLVPLSLWNLTQLTHLDLSRNTLHGDIPSLLSNLKHLTLLDLRSNKFSGHIPDVFNNFPKLDYLALSSNSLEGQLPSSLLDLTQLSSLVLSDNRLIGPIPSKNVTLSKLETLDLHNNSIDGTIPDWCYSLSSLITLDLYMNHLTGPIRKFSSYSLTYLFLSDNKFQGDFPNSIFEFLKDLEYLYMSSNDLSGLVDFSHFSKLENLVSIDLSNNKFLSIDINSSIDYTLPKLDSFYFSSCSLTVFPPFLARLQNLRSLDLSNNKIHGKIPNWFNDNLINTWKNFNHIDLSFNKLQGELPIPPYVIQVFSISKQQLHRTYFFKILQCKLLLCTDLVSQPLVWHNSSMSWSISFSRHFGSANEQLSWKHTYKFFSGQ